jgi:hypothetical protein
MVARLAVARGIRSLSLFALAFSLAFGGLRAQAVTLARKYTAGEEHVFRTTVLSSSATGMGNMVMSQTTVTREKVIRVYTLKEIVTENGHRIAKITVSGTQGLTPGADSPLTMTGATIGPGQLTGEIDFDIDQGFEIRSVTTTTQMIAVMGQSITSESRIEKVLVP